MQFHGVSWLIALSTRGAALFVIERTLLATGRKARKSYDSWRSIFNVSIYCYKSAKFLQRDRSFIWFLKGFATHVFVYTITMWITFDPAKRARTLAERNLDFIDAAEVFEGLTFEFEDRRRNYDEVRMICYGTLEGRMVVVGYTERGRMRHIFSMRKANEREQARIAPLLGIEPGEGRCPRDQA